jgi:hypothetical protein
VDRRLGIELGENGEKKSAGVASLRGQGTPAYPARLRSERARNSSRILPAAGQEAVKEILLPQVVKVLQVRPADFFAAAKPRAAAKQEAGDFPSRNSLFIFVAAKEFVALDGGNHADGAFFAWLGALHAAEAAYANRSGQSDLVGKSQKNLNGRAFPDILGKKEIDTAGADVP